MDGEMRDLIEGSLPHENCQAEYWKQSQELSAVKGKLWDAEAALDAITDGKSKLARELVRRRTLGEGALPAELTANVSKQLRDIASKFKEPSNFVRLFTPRGFCVQAQKTEEDHAESAGGAKDITAGRRGPV